MTRIRGSVIVPAWNAARHLEGLLFDLMHQTVKDVEIIVADDGSTDDTAAVVARYPGIRYVAAEVNRGPGVARNRGVLAAGGDVLLFVDADCRVFPTWVERHLAAHRALEHAIISGPVRGVSAGYFGQADVFACWYAMRPGRPSGLETKMHVPTPNVSVKRATFERLGLFDEGLRMCEDAEFCFRAWRAGLTTYMDSTNAVLHRNVSGFRRAMRHNFGVGPYAVALRRHAPDTPYGWIIPRNAVVATLAVPVLALLHTGWLVRRWVGCNPRVLLYLPALYLLKVAHSAGIPWGLWTGRSASTPHVPRLPPREM